jgi:hypothetical protein
MPAPGPFESGLGDAVERLLHLEDPLRLEAYKSALGAPSTVSFDEPTRRLLGGLHFGLKPSRDGPATLEDSLALLHQHPALVQELRELLPLLDDASAHVTYPLDNELGWAHRVPLSVHARHTLRDVLTAFGLLAVGGPRTSRRGSSATSARTATCSS